MQVSAELRWYWRSAAPQALVEWFRSDERHPCPPGGGTNRRVDRYRPDTRQDELAIKVRGEKSGLEVKGRVERVGSLGDDPFVGEVELWTKWTLEDVALEASALVDVTQLRWVRTLDTTASVPVEIELDAREGSVDGTYPTRGCQIELTQVHVLDEEWWSFGFESFGRVNDVVESLRRGAEVMAHRSPPALTGGRLMSSPAWLKSRLEVRSP